MSKSKNVILAYLANASLQYNQGQLGKNLKEIYFRYYHNEHVAFELHEMIKYKKYISDKCVNKNIDLVLELLQIVKGDLIVEQFENCQLTEIFHDVLCN